MDHTPAFFSAAVRTATHATMAALLMALAGPAAAQTPNGTPIHLGLDEPPWQAVQVGKNLTANRFERRLWDGVDALEVHSTASMSLMARPLTIDLHATPVLCWRWRIAQVVPNADMHRRDSDDYAARVYVSFTLPAASMGVGVRTQLRLARAIWGPNVPDAALNYVWDNRHPVGTEQPNAYTDRAMMVVLRSGNDEAGRWIEERRNVRSDVARLFSADAQAVQLAVTADTDNTRQTAHAGFADFHFVAADQACQFAS